MSLFCSVFRFFKISGNVWIKKYPNILLKGRPYIALHAQFPCVFYFHPILWKKWWKPRFWWPECRWKIINMSGAQPSWNLYSQKAQNSNFQAQKKSDQDHFSLLRYFNLSETNPEKVEKNRYWFWRHFEWRNLIGCSPELTNHRPAYKTNFQQIITFDSLDGFWWIFFCSTGNCFSFKIL